MSYPILANKNGHAEFTKSRFDLFARLNTGGKYAAYDHAYGIAANVLRASRDIVREIINEEGYRIDEIDFYFTDGTRGTLTAEGFHITIGKK